MDETQKCPNCSRSHPPEAFEGRRNCPDCRARLHAWREANKDRIAATTRAYREANRERVAEVARAYAPTYREANRERIAARKRAHYLANREQILATQRNYQRDVNTSRIQGRDYRAAWRVASPERVSSWRETNRPDGMHMCRKCHTRKPFAMFSENKSRPGWLPTECRACNGRSLYRKFLPVWQAGSIDPERCYLCGLPGASHGEHFIPQAAGGPSEGWNMYPACAACNSRKGDAPALEYLNRLPFLVMGPALWAALCWEYAPDASD